MLFPSRQDLRPEVFPRENLLTELMAFIYSFDTSTGVCPSLHVAYSMGIASTWLGDRRASPAFKVFVTASAVVISLSTMFVKQHSAVDVIAAVALGILTEIAVRYLMPKLPFYSA